MARIRSIKPEFWSSEQVMACSPITRLLFVGLWNFADDSGRMKLAARTIKAQIFPADDISAESIRGMVDELSSNGLIELYDVDGTEYFQITGWHHQKIDKPQKPKHPAKPADYSPNIQRKVATDLILEDRKGGEGKQDAEPSARIDDSEPDLFRRGKQLLGPSAGGLIKNVLKAKQGNVALARSAIELASTKQDPREYLGAIIRGRDGPDDARLRGDAW